jgi:exonuclease VII small subunit
MSDNVIATAAEELKKWLETLEKILSKMESDKMAAGKAKLDGERFDSMMKELKSISKSAENGPKGPQMDELNKKIDLALDKMNDLSPKTGQAIGRKLNIDGKHVNPAANSQGMQQALKSVKIGK